MFWKKKKEWTKTKAWDVDFYINGSEYIRFRPASDSVKDCVLKDFFDKDKEFIRFGNDNEDCYIRCSSVAAIRITPYWDCVEG